MLDGVAREVRGLFVAPEDLVHWAVRVRPHLDRMAAGSGGRYLGADLLVELAAGRMQLWVALDGAEIVAVMLTQIIPYPRRRALRCIGIVGSRPRRWVHLMVDVERMAKASFGCDLMEALHQPGHERLLRTPGWRPWHAMAEKAL